MRRGWIYGLAGLLALIGLLPALSVWLSIRIADAHGCILNEAGTNPCLIDGVDQAGMLGFMAFAGWYFLLTWPLVLAGIGLVALLGLIDLVRWVKSR